MRLLKRSPEGTKIMLIAILTTLHIVICFFLILVVLLQQGKGADLSVFGGGSTQAVFGARGAATILHKLTVAGFIAFIVTTISIGFLGAGSSATVMKGASTQQETAPDESEAAADAGEEAGDAELAAPGAEVAPAEDPAQTTGDEPPAADPDGQEGGGSR